MEWNPVPLTGGPDSEWCGWFKVLVSCVWEAEEVVGKDTERHKDEYQTTHASSLALPQSKRV